MPVLAWGAWAWWGCAAAGGVRSQPCAGCTRALAAGWASPADCSGGACRQPPLGTWPRHYRPVLKCSNVFPLNSLLLGCTSKGEWSCCFQGKPCKSLKATTAGAQGCLCCPVCLLLSPPVKGVLSSSSQSWSTFLPCQGSEQEPRAGGRG